MTTETGSETTTVAEPTAAADAATTTTEVQTPAVAEPTAAATETKPEVKAGAPDAYEFKTPEGFEGREFDAGVLAKFSDVARELNLDNVAAQKVIDGLAPALAAKQEAALQSARTAWSEATKIDKELGGEKLAENLAIASLAVKTYGTPELAQLLDQSGLGEHPEVIRVMHRISKALGLKGDSIVTTNTSGVAGEKDIAKTMFPNQN